MSPECAITIPSTSYTPQLKRQTRIHRILTNRTPSIDTHSFFLYLRVLECRRIPALLLCCIILSSRNPAGLYRFLVSQITIGPVAHTARNLNCGCRKKRHSQLRSSNLFLHPSLFKLLVYIPPHLVFVRYVFGIGIPVDNCYIGLRRCCLCTYGLQPNGLLRSRESTTIKPSLQQEYSHILSSQAFDVRVGVVRVWSFADNDKP